MKRFDLMILLFLTLLGCAAISLALPTPRDKEVRVDSYTDPDGVGMWLYWCKPQGVNPCADSEFSNAQRVDVGMPTRDPLTSQHVVDVLNTVSGAKSRLCFRMTAHDAAGNESAFGTLAPGKDGCGWFGFNNPKNQVTQ